MRENRPGNQDGSPHLPWEGGIVQGLGLQYLPDRLQCAGILGSLKLVSPLYLRAFNHIVPGLTRVF
jgi:hypothetical protein